MHVLSRSLSATAESLVNNFSRSEYKWFSVQRIKIKWRYQYAAGACLLGVKMSRVDHAYTTVVRVTDSSSLTLTLTFTRLIAEHSTAFSRLFENTRCCAISQCRDSSIKSAVRYVIYCPRLLLMYWQTVLYTWHQTDNLRSTGQFLPKISAKRIFYCILVRYVSQQIMCKCKLNLSLIFKVAQLGWGSYWCHYEERRYCRFVSLFAIRNAV